MSGTALDLHALGLNELFDRLRRGDAAAPGEIIAALAAKVKTRVNPGGPA